MRVAFTPVVLVNGRWVNDVVGSIRGKVNYLKDGSRKWLCNLIYYPA